VGKGSLTSKDSDARKTQREMIIREGEGEQGKSRPSTMAWGKKRWSEPGEVKKVIRAPKREKIQRGEKRKKSRESPVKAERGGYCARCY